MATIKVKTEFAKNLEVNISESESLNSFQELQTFNNQIDTPDVPPETDTQYATPPPSSNFDLKTLGVSGILTMLLGSPLILKLFEGADLKEIVIVAVDLIKSNIWLIGILGVIYLLRETIQSALKQWTFGKVIDAKADPNKNNVEIKTTDS